MGTLPDAPTDRADGPIIGILSCDHVMGDDLLIASRGRDYADMYAELLGTAVADLRFRTYDAVAGELPDDPSECDAWLITGARHDAYRDEPWTVQLREFVRRLHDRRSRTVGICFGHQLLAHALGGRAEPAGEWKAGPQELVVEPTPWFEGGAVTMHAMHQDVVSALPPGARTIGTGTTAEHPIFVVDDSILGIQDHPEFDADYTAALIEARRERMGDAMADASLARVADTATHSDVVGRWIADFLLDRRR